MGEHTKTPWVTQPCGELAPNDVMIVADMGKLPNGIQQISTVARALSVRQTPETTAANAAFIVKAVNSHEALVAEAERLKGINTGLVNDFNTLLIENARLQDRADGAEAKLDAAMDLIRAAGLMANVCFNAKQSEKLPETVRFWLGATQEDFDKARDKYLSVVGASSKP